MAEPLPQLLGPLFSPDASSHPGQSILPLAGACVSLRPIGSAASLWILAVWERS